MEHLVNCTTSGDIEQKYIILPGCTIDDLTEEELRILYKQQLKNKEIERYKFDKLFQEKVKIEAENQELRERLKKSEVDPITINQLNVTIDTLADKLAHLRKCHGL